MRPVADILAALPDRISALVWHWERATPDAPAMRQDDFTWSWAQLAGAVRRARARLAGLGVGPGDRVMLVGENGLALCVLVLAAGDLDAWPAIINARLAGSEIDAIRDHCRPRRVLYLTGESPDAAGHAARHGAETLESGLAVGALLAAEPEPVEAGGAGQVAALIYTSGTTGAPKGVMLTHRNILYVAAVSGGLRRLAPDDLVYAVLPFSHVFGLASVFTGTLWGGGCLMPVPRFQPAHILAALADGVTVFQGVPAMHARLLEFLRREGRTVTAPRLRLISAGGSPLDPALKAEAEAMFGLPLHNGYGLTEAAPTISQTRLEDPRSDCSVGPPLPAVEARLAGAVDGVGELWIRSPGVMKGYYRDPSLTAQVIDRDGWLNTGDLARFDVEGQLSIVGRSKELIIRSGFNVYPGEVEAALNAHPAIIQSAVVGRPAADGNEEVVAYVQVAAGDETGPIDLAAFVAARLAPYKRPARIVVMAALPAGPTGKILKSRLAAMARSDGA